MSTSSLPAKPVPGKPKTVLVRFYNRYPYEVRFRSVGFFEGASFFHKELKSGESCDDADHYTGTRMVVVFDAITQEMFEPMPVEITQDCRVILREGSIYVSALTDPLPTARSGDSTGH